MPQQPDRFGGKREEMVARQIAARGIRDARVLAALRAVPRHLFMPEDDWELAYEDHPVPIGHGQTISQPYIVGLMTERLQIAPGSKVLEIGTGSGYQTALLAELGAAVHSIEIMPALHEQARRTLEALGYGDRVRLKLGNGYLGWPEHAPFDRIIITAAPPFMPRRLMAQLADDGLMLAPLGVMAQKLVLLRKRPDGQVDETFVEHVRFVPMVNETEDE